MPLFKKIDKVFFGIEDLYEIEKKVDAESENEEQFDREESI